MRSLLFLAVVLIVFSCGNALENRATKVYEIQLVFNSGETDTLKYSGSGENYFRLALGDFSKVQYGNPRVLFSGVREFKVLKIRLPYDSSEINKTIPLWK